MEEGDKKWRFVSSLFFLVINVVFLFWAGLLRSRKPLSDEFKDGAFKLQS